MILICTSVFIAKHLLPRPGLPGRTWGVPGLDLDYARVATEKRMQSGWQQVASDAPPRGRLRLRVRGAAARTRPGGWLPGPGPFVRSF